MADRGSLAHTDGLERKSERLVLESRPGEWIELFKGNPKFGYVTGIFTFGDRTFFFDSPVPAGTNGGDIYVWDTKQNKARKVGQVQEQGVTYMRQFNKNLYIPGPDAIESWDLANFYKSGNNGEKWSKVRTIPNGVHVWDLCFWRGKMYVSTGSVKKGEGYGAVLESSDEGKTWKESLAAYPPDRKNQFARCYALIPQPDGLYASWLAIDNDPKKPGPKATTDFYKFDGKTWTPLTLFPSPPRTPYFGLRHREFRNFALVGCRGSSFMLRNGKVQRLEGLEDVTVFDFATLNDKEVIAVATDPQLKASATYKAPVAPLGDRVGKFVKFADLPEGHEGISLSVVGEKPFVGTKAEDGGAILTEGTAEEGYAYTKVVRVRNRGTMRISWEGSQPPGSSMQFQVHAARSQRDVVRMTDWAEVQEAPSPKSFEVKGLPTGDVHVQLRIVMRTNGKGALPELRSLKIEAL